MIGDERDIPIKDWDAVWGKCIVWERSFKTFASRVSREILPCRIEIFHPEGRRWNSRIERLARLSIQRCWSRIAQQKFAAVLIGSREPNIWDWRPTQIIPQGGILDSYLQI